MSWSDRLGDAKNYNKNGCVEEEKRKEGTEKERSVRLFIPVFMGDLSTLPFGPIILPPCILHERRLA